jgi:agmatine deiminase
MRYLTCIALAASLCARPAVGAPEDSGDWRFPGEYESHQAMWMTWPVYENKAGFPSTEPMSEMIRAMSGHVAVNLAVQDAADEAAARELLTASGVPLDHVHFFQLEHLDIWARDTGPQFTRSRSGQLRVNDWNFNYWGNEEPESEFSTFDEPFDRTVAETIGVPVLDARGGPETGVRFIHEGGSATHNGHGTMIVVESVVMQRNLGPNRFCGGQAPVTDERQPNTYAPNPDWPACQRLVEREYRRMLGVEKLIWVPTGVIEDTGTFRGALGKHIQVPEWEGAAIPHAGVYTLFTTNGHPDEFLRFVSPDTVLLAEEKGPEGPANTPAERLMRWLQEQNRERLQRVYEILRHEATESGKPLRIVRINTPALTFEVFRPGDGTYDYYAAYDRWEDGSVLPDVMLGVWPASYVNYVPTNDLLIAPRFWRPGRPLEARKRDAAAHEVLRRTFPGREIVQVHIENVVRGGGGMNCITQQQPASAKFARRCGWAKVKVDVAQASLYAGPFGGSRLGMVPRLAGGQDDVYLERLATAGRRIKVRVVGACGLAGRIGWVDRDEIESAGERCPQAYSLN